MTPLQERLVIITRSLAEAHNSLGQCSYDEIELWSEGYFRSPETSTTGRERDAQVHAQSRRSQRVRLEHQVRAMEVERDTIIHLLKAGITDVPANLAPRIEV